MDSGDVLTPGLELGLRHDGGDAETGTGAELGGRVSCAHPGSGLSLEASVRTLIAHEGSSYEEWGASGAVRPAPGASGRGLSFSLAPMWGTPSSGAGRLWSARDARGLAPDGEFEPESRLEGELGYGLPACGGAFTGTPNVGFGLSDTAREYRLGRRLTPAARGHSGFEVNLDATRRESTNDAGPGAAPRHGVICVARCDGRGWAAASPMNRRSARGRVTARHPRTPSGSSSGSGSERVGCLDGPGRRAGSRRGLGRCVRMRGLCRGRRVADDVR